MRRHRASDSQDASASQATTTATINRRTPAQRGSRRKRQKTTAAMMATVTKMAISCMVSNRPGPYGLTKWKSGYAGYRLCRPIRNERGVLSAWIIHERTQTPMNKKVHYLGLDVHRETIAVSIAPQDSTEVRRYGIIGGTLEEVDKLLKKLPIWEGHSPSSPKNILVNWIRSALAWLARVSSKAGEWRIGGTSKCEPHGQAEHPTSNIEIGKRLTSPDSQPPTPVPWHSVSWFMSERMPEGEGQALSKWSVFLDVGRKVRVWKKESDRCRKSARFTADDRRTHCRRKWLAAQVGWAKIRRNAVAEVRGLKWISIGFIITYRGVVWL